MKGCEFGADRGIQTRNIRIEAKIRGNEGISLTSLPKRTALLN